MSVPSPSKYDYHDNCATAAMMCSLSRHAMHVGHTSDKFANLARGLL